MAEAVSGNVFSLNVKGVTDRAGKVRSTSKAEEQPVLHSVETWKQDECEVDDALALLEAWTASPTPTAQELEAKGGKVDPSAVDELESRSSKSSSAIPASISTWSGEEAFIASAPHVTTSWQPDDGIAKDVSIAIPWSGWNLADR